MTKDDYERLFNEIHERLTDDLIPDDRCRQQILERVAPIVHPPKSVPSFDIWWDVMQKTPPRNPRMGGKTVRRRHWARSGCEEIADLIINHTRSCKQHHPDWKKDGGLYQPKPETYINQRLWEEGVRQAPKPEVTAGGDETEWAYLRVITAETERRCNDGGTCNNITPDYVRNNKQVNDEWRRECYRRWNNEFGPKGKEALVVARNLFPKARVG